METHTRTHADRTLVYVPQLSEVTGLFHGLCAAGTCASTIFTCKIDMTTAAS